MEIKKMADFLTMDDYNFENKTAIIRVDFNSPLDSKKNITDDTRIRAHAPTIKELMEKGAKVVMGGPMTGIAIGDLTSPITKTMGAITILTKKQIGRAKHEKRQTPCIRCGRCIQACPENLNPTKSPTLLCIICSIPHRIII